MGTEGPSSQLLFTPISHTEPRKLGRKHIHTFLVERERYILRVKDAQSTGGNQESVSVIASIDPDLLTSLIDLGEFGESVSSLCE